MDGECLGQAGIGEAGGRESQCQVSCQIVLSKYLPGLLIKCVPNNFRLQALALFKRLKERTLQTLRTLARCYLPNNTDETLSITLPSVDWSQYLPCLGIHCNIKRLMVQFDIAELTVLEHLSQAYAQAQSTTKRVTVPLRNTARSDRNKMPLVTLPVPLTMHSESSHNGYSARLSPPSHSLTHSPHHMPGNFGVSVEERNAPNPHHRADITDHVQAEAILFDPDVASSLMEPDDEEVNDMLNPPYCLASTSCRGKHYSMKMMFGESQIWSGKDLSKMTAAICMVGICIRDRDLANQAWV